MGLWRTDMNARGWTIRKIFGPHAMLHRMNLELHLEHMIQVIVQIIHISIGQTNIVGRLLN